MSLSRNLTNEELNKQAQTLYQKLKDIDTKYLMESKTIVREFIDKCAPSKDEKDIAKTSLELYAETNKFGHVMPGLANLFMLATTDIPLEKYVDKNGEIVQ